MTVPNPVSTDHRNLPPHTRRWLPLALVGLVAFGLASACGPSEEELAERMASVRAEMAVTLQGENLPQAARSELEGSRTWTALQERYAGAAPATVWVAGEGPRERADELIATLGGGDENGEGEEGDETADAPDDATGEADDYGASQLAELRDRARLAVEEESADMGRHLANLELAASYAFLTRAFHAIEGRVDPRRLSVGWYMEGRKAQPLELLNRVQEGAAPAEVLADLDPKHEDYHRLEEARDRYRVIVADGGWPRIPADGETLEEGAEGPRVAALRERLVLEGDLEAQGDTGEQAAVLDAEVTEAVRRFQERHGLEVDGVAGGGTLDALNVPAEDRLRTIELNLERWRWLPDDLGERYVEVNLPGFTLEAVDGERVAAEMKVVVGKDGWGTPVLTETMEHVVVNPYWNIPQSILEEDILPKLEENPSYLAEQNMEVVRPGSDEPLNVGAAELASGKYRVRQKPGPGNALGRIKFIFPNHHNVYLHDTPADYAFDRTYRDLSHGCVRVQHPIDLANFVFAGDSRWDGPRIERLIQSREHRTIPLEREIPVYFLYWTAFVDDGGEVQFRPDLYGYDEKHTQALEGRDRTS